MKVFLLLALLASPLASQLVMKGWRSDPYQHKHKANCYWCKFARTA